MNIRRILFSGALFCVFTAGVSQTLPKPIAHFSFDNGKDYDEINHKKARLLGAHPTDDRFGNENHAMFVSGNSSSYINLGCYKQLKPKNGSIALWVKMEHPVWTGKGGKYNPILITKYTLLDDFYESYAIYYMLETGKVLALAVNDSTEEVASFTRGAFTRNEWQHLVLTFDTSYFCFYINGVLLDKLVKKFEIHYMAGDSVVIGSTANKKNRRWFNGSVDDIMFYNKVLTAGEINALYRAPNPSPKTSRVILHWIFTGMGVAFFISLLYILLRRRAVVREKARLELNNTILKTELRVKRASMNPHFLFNSLNTLHTFILGREYENASHYLLKFSKLIRKTLESNMQDFTTLELEIELLERYLELESLRFEKDIRYTITAGDPLVPSAICIPVMMVQPFVENAIWHGLLNKPGEKIIAISFSVYQDDYIYCVVEDNGTGRKEHPNRSPEKRPLATKFVLQRLELLNKIHRLHCSLTIEDKPQGQGTIVKLLLPILNK